MYLKLKVLCTVLLVYHLCQKRNLAICLMFAVQYHVMSSKLPYHSVNCLTTYNSSTIVFEDPTSNSSSRYSEMGGCEKNRLQWLTT